MEDKEKKLKELREHMLVFWADSPISMGGMTDVEKAPEKNRIIFNRIHRILKEALSAHAECDIFIAKTFDYERSMHVKISFDYIGLANTLAFKVVDELNDVVSRYSIDYWSPYGNSKAIYGTICSWGTRFALVKKSDKYVEIDSDGITSEERFYHEFESLVYLTYENGTINLVIAGGEFGEKQIFSIEHE